MEITKDNVLRFLFRVTLGDEFEEVKKQQSEDEIILYCLCLGWNDAFRRTLKNKDGVKITREVKEDVFLKNNCIDRFREYANTESSSNKATMLEKIRDDMAGDISLYKEGEFTIGLAQKIFNIAVKLYVCIYLFSDVLGVKNVVKKYAFDEADCPLDGKILGELNKKVDEGSWSKLNDKKEYIDIQNSIQKRIQGERLLFDFLKW